MIQNELIEFINLNKVKDSIIFTLNYKECLFVKSMYVKILKGMEMELTKNQIKIPK